MLTWKQSGSAWEIVESVPLADRGFRYGMSVFETITVVAGRPLFLDAHLERLRWASGDCGLDLPPLPDFDFSSLWTGLLRFYVTAGLGGPCDPFLGNVYALFDQAEVGWNLPALRVMSCAAPYLPRPGGWKSGNYWQNIEAMSQAKRAACDEALLFNPAGMLVGAAMANVFLQIDGTWVTPALETGARNGAVRSWVLSHFGVEEGILESRDVARCRAAFLTNSRIGIRSVQELDGRPLANEAGGIQQKYFDDIFAT
jgi:branched-subunit amino acid aminotransferase/4-amino-4-deoxychorismate lyase